MSRFQDLKVVKSCLDFITGRAVITASLPSHKPFCQYCRWSKHDYGLDRQICLLTGEYLMDFKHSIGEQCPIEWEEKSEDDIEY